MLKVKNIDKLFHNLIVINLIIIGVFWLPNYSYAHFNLPSNPFTLNHFSASNKLPGETVQGFYQDEIGILWLSIESVGIIKYDGKKITIHQNINSDSSSLSTNYPKDIIGDNQGTIWVSTSNGLNAIKRASSDVKRYMEDQESISGLSHNSLNNLTIDSYGNLWISTQNGLNILNPKREEFLKVLHSDDFDKPSSYNEIKTIHLDKKGNIWIGTTHNGVFIISKDNIEILNSVWQKQSAEEFIDSLNEIIRPKQLLSKSVLPTVMAFESNNSDTIWMATQTGLYYYHTDTKVVNKYIFNNHYGRILNNSTLVTLKADSNGRLWVGAASDGLAIIELENLTYHYLNANNYATNQLKSNFIRKIYETSCGLIWIATKFGGLHYYDSRNLTFQHIKFEQEPGFGLNESFTLALLDDDDKIWIGTKGGGLNKINKQSGQFSYYTNEGKIGDLLSNRVEALVKDYNETLWIATEAGLFSMDKDQDYFHHYSHAHIRNLYLDGDYLWIGTDYGLSRFSISKRELSPLETRHNNFFNPESNIYITRVMHDSDGTMWIGTFTNGLYEYHAESDSLIHHLHIPNNSRSLSGNQVRAIYEDKNKRLWIGTKSDGLNCFDKEIRDFYNVSNPSVLPSNTIYHILEDDFGNLWLGTHNGISKFNTQQNIFTSFTTTYGLQGQIFEINGSTVTSEGLLLMGGSNGFNVIDPKNINIEQFKAPLIISDFKVSNESLATDISEYTEFHLNTKNNYISFEFALLDYTSPDENLYYYQLYPFDAEYIYANTRNFASYTNLKPGNYLFRVISSNTENFINTGSFEISIFIPSPLWRKPRFISFVIIVLSFLIILGYFLKSKAVKRRELHLKHEVSQRTQDLLNAYKKLEVSNKQIENQNVALRKQRDRISRQNLELKIHRQNLENMVSDRTKDLEEAKAKAEESDRLKSAFLANMSHEIRTPLNAIMGFIDILEVDEFSENEKKAINEIIQTNSNALLQLINDIIDISMIEANQLTIKKERIEFNKFFNDIYQHYQANHELQIKQVEFNKQTPAKQETIYVYTDLVRTRQIFTNLINNAIKFTFKGSITIGYYVDITTNEVIIFVKDTGIGVSEENAKLLFERFRKIDSTNFKIHRGTGLGLSISKHLCKLLNGRIWLKSQLNEGSTFYFTLPIHQIV